MRLVRVRRRSAVFDYNCCGGRVRTIQPGHESARIDSSTQAGVFFSAMGKVERVQHRRCPSCAEAQGALSYLRVDCSWIPALLQRQQCYQLPQFSRDRTWSVDVSSLPAEVPPSDFESSLTLVVSSVASSFVSINKRAATWISGKTVRARVLISGRARQAGTGTLHDCFFKKAWKDKLPIWMVFHMMWRSLINLKQ